MKLNILKPLLYYSKFAKHPPTLQCIFKFLIHKCLKVSLVFRDEFLQTMHQSMGMVPKKFCTGN